MNSEIVKVWDYKNGTQCCIKHNQYPKETRKILEETDQKFGVPLSRYEWHCGYVALPGLEIDLTEMRASELDVDVHGGITWMEEEEGAIVFGFDCNHIGDVNREKVSNLEWLTNETEKMADQLITLFNYQGRLPG